MTKNKRKKDPYAKREAQKYDKPVPSREYILELLYERKAPASQKEIIHELGLTEPDDKIAIKRRIRAMLRDHQLQRWGKFSYWPADELFEVIGEVIYDRGQFFVKPETGAKHISVRMPKDLIVNFGDKVRVMIPSVRGTINTSAEGEITEVISSGTYTVVGRFVEERGFNYVVSYGVGNKQDILIPQGKEANAQDSDLVKVEIISSATNWQEPLGKVIEIVGSIDVPTVVIEGGLHNYNIPYSWPKDVSKDLKKLPEEISKNEIGKRYDLRHLPFVTIDGSDARDFDDAVYCQSKAKGGWKLFVAIADVSHYVKENTALNTEAYNRGTSVYFPSKVVPMLPEVLSNGLCSLRPDEDKLVLVCEMSVSATGKVTRYQFYDGVICSHARLTYDEVEKYLKEGATRIPRKHGDEVSGMLDEIYEMYSALLEQREERGAISFDTVETKIKFGKNDKIQKIEPVVRGDAHKIIEECMLAANVAAAKYILKHQKNGIFRNHLAPPPEKLKDLEDFLRGLGVQLRAQKKDIATKDYAQILEKVRGRPEASVIQKMVLRSMSQAVYDEANDGHFGLAYAAYTHFTSPIRRYPDLVVHRILKLISAGQHRAVKSSEQLGTVAQHCSFTERRADEVTRDVTKVFKCQYMLRHIGKTFDAVITGVTQFGIFAEMKGVYVDGLVHVTSMSDDYYHFNPISSELVGELTGNSYKIGDEVKVIVAKVDIDKRRIDLVFSNQQEKPTARQTKKLRLKEKHFKKDQEKPKRVNKGKRAARKKKADVESTRAPKKSAKAKKSNKPAKQRRSRKVKQK